MVGHAAAVSPGEWIIASALQGAKHGSCSNTIFIRVPAGIRNTGDEFKSRSSMRSVTVCAASPASWQSARDAEPGLKAAIVNRAVYDSIVTRAVSTKSCPVVEKVLADPSAEVPADTQARVIPPGTLGSGVDRADTWSLVLVPDDGRSPVHRILFDKDGVIVGRVGPYHRA